MDAGDEEKCRERERESRQAIGLFVCETSIKDPLGPSFLYAL